MQVAIVGAGPAGAHLAYLLSSMAHDVTVFDAREAWEKPCGGGVTSKALREFAFLARADWTRQSISDVKLISGTGREVTLSTSEELAVYSRAELSRLMRKLAVDAGARLICQRVEKTVRKDGKWSIHSGDQVYIADLLVGADGASSIIRRRVGVQLNQEDFSYALGWHVHPSRSNGRNRIDIKYLDNFTGYIWAFPRTDHISYGIASKYREWTPADLKGKLRAFMRQDGIDCDSNVANVDATFYAAMLPALEESSWDHLRVVNQDEGWALVGDAAGFVDPLTGEGIYYALKSAELLASAVESRLSDYEEMWRREFGAELSRASQLQGRFYHGRFAGKPFLERMVQFAGWHRGVRATLGDLISGNQSYIDLKSRLKRNALRIV
jgi:geranylgeranyl reductase family protein